MRNFSKSISKSQLGIFFLLKIIKRIYIRGVFTENNRNRALGFRLFSMLFNNVLSITLFQHSPKVQWWCPAQEEADESARQKKIILPP